MSQSAKRPIKILIDGRSLIGTKSGIGYYTYGLIEALSRQYPEEVVLIVHYFNFLKRRSNLDLPQGSNIRYRPTLYIPGKLFNLLRRLGLEVPFELLVKTRGDFMLFPSYISYPSIFHTPSATAVHDLSFIDMPDTVSPANLRDLLRWVPKSVKRSSFIIAISDVMKQKLVSHFSLNNGQVVVTHIPPQPSKTSASTSEPLTKLGIKKQFILFVGNLEPRKNIVGLIKAYSLLDPALRQKYSLVLAGGKGWNDEAITNEIEQSQKTGMDIIVPGYVDDQTRAALYDNATVFSFVTFYEGFGMPALEAMSHSLPVLASDIPVLHEVCGETALYCNPNEPNDVSKKLSDLLSNKTLQTELVAKGSKQLALFSWQEVANTIFTAVQSKISK